MRRALVSFIAAATFAAPAFAANISVPVDEVRIVTFKKPISTVYVGNPTIADITTIDETRVFVLGKSFGSTNLIALGRDGKPIANENVTVFGRRMGAVTLNKGAQQYTYSCTSAQCQPAPVVGDSSDYHKSIHDEVASHSAALLKAADASK